MRSCCRWSTGSSPDPSGVLHQGRLASAVTQASLDRDIGAASYKRRGSRGELVRNRKFCALFKVAKQRVRKMDVRYVEETDPIGQALLEIYAALALKTKYNEFDTH